MKYYQYNSGHDRVSFSARDVLNIRPVLEALSNTHPTFVSIRARFTERTVDISVKQAEVLNRTLASENQPHLDNLVLRNPFADAIMFRGSVETAVRRIMSHLDCGTYADWTYTDELANIPPGMMVLEVSAERTFYAAFRDRRDMDTATIALETPGYLM